MMAAMIHLWLWFCLRAGRPLPNFDNSDVNMDIASPFPSPDHIEVAAQAAIATAFRSVIALAQKDNNVLPLEIGS